MTLKYLSGNRVTGLSTDTKPMSVVTNSVFFETDTSTTYDFDGSSWTARSSGGSETHSFTSVSTFTPNTQTGITRVSVDTSSVIRGRVIINVDGSVVQDIPKEESKFRVVNPTTSLTIKSEKEGWDISSATYDSVSFSVSSQTNPQAIVFNDDGTKMFVLGNSPDSIFQYSLSTAFDLSTASYDSVSFSVSSQEGNPHGLAIKPDGTKFWIVGQSNDTVYQYSMSTAFDMSTASYDSVSYAMNLRPSGLRFNNDGTKMFRSDDQTGRIYQYTMSTAWDISTASFDFHYSVFSTAGYPYDLWFNNDGTEMFVVGGNYDKIYAYILSTAFDVSSASYDSASISLSSQETNAQAIAFNNNGTKMYIAGETNDTVYQYSTLYPFSGTALATVG